MTKKFFSILAVLGIAATMFLSSCTAAGVECGLIGKWEGSATNTVGKYEYTIEITNDDNFKKEETVTMTILSTTTTTSFTVDSTVKSVTENVIELNNGEGYKYQNLSSDSVEFLFTPGWVKLTKVN